MLMMMSSSKHIDNPTTHFNSSEKCFLLGKKNGRYMPDKTAGQVNTSWLALDGWMGWMDGWMGWMGWMNRWVVG